MKEHIHKFKIDGKDFESTIRILPDGYEHKLIKGNTGLGAGSGGKDKSLNEYIEYLEQEHNWAYWFFKVGYQEAKQKVI